MVTHVHEHQIYLIVWSVSVLNEGVDMAGTLCSWGEFLHDLMVLFMVVLDLQQQD